MSLMEMKNTRAAKLTVSDVMRIRELYAGGWTQGALAREYKMGVAQIGRIVRGESWSHIPHRPPTPEEIRVSRERVERMVALGEGMGVEVTPELVEKPWEGPLPTQETIDRAKAFGSSESTIARMEKALADRRKLTDVSELQEGEMPDAGY